jgi:hypothetical protein
MMSEVRSRVKTKVFSTAADFYGVNLRICQAAAAVFLHFSFCMLLTRACFFFLFADVVCDAGWKEDEGITWTRTEVQRAAQLPVIYC